MKKWLAIGLAMMFASVSHSQVISAWNYDGLADGSGRSTALSTGLAPGVAWGNTTMCSVQDGALLWTPPDLSKAGDFSAVSFGDYSGKDGGIFRLEMDYVSAEMANTFAAHESAKVALNIQSSGGANAGFRLRYDGMTNVTVITDIGGGLFETNYVDRNEFQLDYNNAIFATFPGHTLGTNINVNALYDINEGTISIDYTYDGVTSNAYNGTLPDDFNFSDLRWVTQANNGGAHWQLGDSIVTDNIVLTMLEEPVDPPPPAPLTGIVEEWLFNDEADGTGVAGLINSAPEPYGLCKWGGDKAWNFTTNGVFRFENGGTQASYRNSAISQLGSTNGQYELSWDIPRAQVAGTDINNGAVLSMGMRDAAESKSAFEVRLVQQNGSLILQTKINTTTANFKNFEAATISNVSVRVIADYDTDTFDVYYTWDGADEVLGADDVAMYNTTGKASLDSLYMIAVTKDANFGADDFFEMDNLKLTALYVPPALGPEGLYGEWLAGYDVGTSTNLQDDADGDLLDNLTEYAFGGDPSDINLQGNTPVQSQVADGDANYMEYIYFEREDAANRGLASVLEVGTDLVVTDWTTNGVEFVGSGASDIEGFNSVTNRVLTDDEDKQFLKLKVIFTP